MADILHGSARTTPRVRAELQASKEATGNLARRYGLSRTTVAKWRSRTTTADAPMGPRDPKSTVLTPVEEAMIVEFRRRTLLPLDDVLGCLKDSIPELTRSSLHRCLVRHGISRLPASGEKASKRGRFADTTIGYVHIDICELRLAEGKLNMFLAIDRVSKFTYVEFHEKAGKMNGAAFMANVVKGDVPLFVEHCEAVAAKVEVTRRWLGEQGRRELRVSFDVLPERHGALVVARVTRTEGTVS